ncbi:MAG: HoxA-like transcriptional regulator [uncultured archaeon A07HN63]|nr:MAG: HoxA-like transcriptional regulator [uncultured archaeon A07HN63]
MSDATADSPVPRVIAVEDNPADVRLLREGIAAAETTLELTVFNNGQNAADHLAAIAPDAADEHPDLILLDLNTPGRSGFELLELIRTDTAFQAVPVVIVSSSKNPQDIDRAYEQSANAYATKPADPDEHIRMIDATIEFWIATVSPFNSQ